MPTDPANHQITQTEAFGIIAQIISEDFGVAVGPSQISLESRFVADLGLDPLDLFELVQKLADQGVGVAEFSEESPVTVGDLLNCNIMSSGAEMRLYLFFGILLTIATVAMRFIASPLAKAV
jgi:acyl carrier protein